MPNTYTQIHLHCVFCPRYREGLITPDWAEPLHKYITGIIQNHDHKMLAINTMPDHLHMLFGMRPNEKISDIMQYVKKDSTIWINENKFTKKKFHWQDGYGAFAYEKRRVPDIIKYIRNQQEHHKKITWNAEYISLLKEHEIDFDHRYLFCDPV